MDTVELKTRIASILESSLTSKAQHHRCLQELHELLDTYPDKCTIILKDTFILFIVSSENINTPEGGRLKDLWVSILAPSERPNSENIKEAISDLFKICVPILYSASKAQKLDIRLIATQILSGMSFSAFSSWNKKIKLDIVQNLLDRIEDRSANCRELCVKTLIHLNKNFSDTIFNSEQIRRLCKSASSDLRPEVRLNCLALVPLTYEGIKVLAERTGDINIAVRTTALNRLLGVPITDLLDKNLVQLILDNMYLTADVEEAEEGLLGGDLPTIKPVDGYKKSFLRDFRNNNDSDSSVSDESSNSAANADILISFPPNVNAPREELHTQEHTFFLQLLSTWLKQLDSDMWKFCKTLVPNCHSYKLLHFILRIMFTNGVPLPSDLNEKVAENIETLTITTAIVVAFCEAHKDDDPEKVDELIPDLAMVAEQLNTLSPEEDATRLHFLLLLMQYQDFMDEHGRLLIREAYYNILKKLPSHTVIKSILNGLPATYYSSFIPNPTSGDYVEYIKDMTEFLKTQWYPFETVISISNQQRKSPTNNNNHKNNASNKLPTKLETIEDYKQLGDFKKLEGCFSTVALFLEKLPSMTSLTPLVKRLETDIFRPSFPIISLTRKYIEYESLHAAFVNAVGAIGNFSHTTRCIYFPSFLKLFRSTSTSDSVKLVLAKILVNWIILIDENDQQTYSKSLSGVDVSVDSNVDASPSQNTEDLSIGSLQDHKGWLDTLCALLVKRVVHTRSHILLWPCTISICRLLYHNLFSQTSQISDFLWHTFTYIAGNQAYREYLENFFEVCVTYPLQRQLLCEAFEKMQLNSPDNTNANVRRAAISYMVALLLDSFETLPEIEKYSTSLIEFWCSPEYVDWQFEEIKWGPICSRLRLNQESITSLESNTSLLASRLSKLIPLVGTGGADSRKKIHIAAPFPKSKRVSMPVPSSSSSPSSSSFNSASNPKAVLEIKYDAKTPSSIPPQESPRSGRTSTLEKPYSSSRFDSSAAAADARLAAIGKHIAELGDLQLEFVPSKKKHKHTVVQSATDTGTNTSARISSSDGRSALGKRKLAPQKPVISLDDEDDPTSYPLQQINHDTAINIDGDEITDVEIKKPPRKKPLSKIDTDKMLSEIAHRLRHDSESASIVQQLAMKLQSSEVVNGSTNSDITDSVEDVSHETRRVSSHGYQSTVHRIDDSNEEDDNLPPRKQHAKRSESSLKKKLSSPDTSYKSDHSSPPKKVTVLSSTTPTKDIRQATASTKSGGSSPLSTLNFKEYTELKGSFIQPPEDTREYLVGLAGFSSNEQEKYIAQLDALGLPHVVLVNYTKELANTLTHILIKPGLQSRTICYFAASGIWIVEPAWIRKCSALGQIVTPSSAKVLNFRLTCDFLKKLPVALSPKLEKSNLNKFVQTFISTTSASVVDIEKAKLVLVTDSNDIVNAKVPLVPFQTLLKDITMM